MWKLLALIGFLMVVSQALAMSGPSPDEPNNGDDIDLNSDPFVSQVREGQSPKEDGRLDCFLHVEESPQQSRIPSEKNLELLDFELRVFRPNQSESSLSYTKVLKDDLKFLRESGQALRLQRILPNENGPESSLNSDMMLEIKLDREASEIKEARVIQYDQELRCTRLRPKQ